MRKLTLVAGLVVASVVLSACGSASAKATLHELVGSLGSSPDLQVTLTASAVHTHSATAQKALGAVSVEMLFENPSGAALSNSGGNANTEFLVKVEGTPLLDLREVDGNLYAYVNVDAVSKIPGEKVSAAQLATANLLVGGRWFEFPKSLIDKVVPKSAASSAEAQKVRSIEAKLINKVVNVILTTPSTKLAGGGYTETGTLESIAAAVEPTVLGLAGRPSDSAAPVGGTYQLTVLTSGSTATGASISVTAKGATVGLAASFAHAGDAVSTPAHATLVGPNLLRLFGAVDHQSASMSSSKAFTTSSSWTPAR
jgi:hypothetical protein